MLNIMEPMLVKMDLRKYLQWIDRKFLFFADDKSHVGRQISFSFSFSFFIEIKVGLRDLNASDFIIFNNLRRNIFSYYVAKVQTRLFMLNTNFKEKYEIEKYKMLQ